MASTRTYEKTNFVFDEHVVPMNPSLVRKQIESDTRFAMFRKKFIEERVGLGLSILGEDYDKLRTFFEIMQDKKYCQCYCETDFNGEGAPLKSVVKMAGEGLESFIISSGYEFLKDEMGNKSMIIPVKKLGEQFNLIIDRHSQIEMPVGEEILVDYKFETHFSLGDVLLRDLFVGNPFEIESDFLKSVSGGYSVPTFCGGIEKLYYRKNDRLFCGMVDAIFGKMMYPLLERKNFKMGGKIYLNGGEEVISRGDIDSTGTFPFFISD